MTAVWSLSLGEPARGDTGAGGTLASLNSHERCSSTGSHVEVGDVLPVEGLGDGQLP